MLIYHNKEKTKSQKSKNGEISSISSSNGFNWMVPQQKMMVRMLIQLLADMLKYGETLKLLAHCSVQNRQNLRTN